MSRHWPALLAVACSALSGCTPTRSTDFRVALPDQTTYDATAAIEVTIHRGTCDEPGEVVYAHTFARDRTGAAPPRLAAGTYTVQGIARDDSCGILAETCQILELPLPEGEALTLALDSVMPLDAACEAAACTCGGCNCTVDSCDLPCVIRDAGARDAEIDGAIVDDPTACDDLLAGAVFCDGFEDGPSFPAWGWDVLEDGTVTDAMDVVHRGNGSLHAASTAAGGRAELGKSFAPMTTGDVWARTYVYVPASSPVTQLNLFHLGEPTSPFDNIVVGLHTPTTVLRATLYARETGVTKLSSPAEFPRERWVCVQLHLELSATAGVAQLYLDGELVITLSPIDTVPSAGIGAIGIGIGWSPDTQLPTGLYVDEVAVGTAPLPCDS